MGETETERVKREVLGIGERRKHHTRKATPLKSHAKAPDTHHRLYRFRFYPTEEQAEQLERTFGACRWVYNEGLALRSGAWERYRVNVGFRGDVSGIDGVEAEGGDGVVGGRVVDGASAVAASSGSGVRPFFQG
ncbi:helix-turn-helix domain-containing protein [Streptomyces canus]|uniref:helix-turn-helix domain-containing protein n=1 Tax=Streptomyces canus TaxID=58343 RepID=UPI0036C63820